jgi:hypothetical protein
MAAIFNMRNQRRFEENKKGNKDSLPVGAGSGREKYCNAVPRPFAL